MGASSGDPELLTGARLALRRAQVVLYDQLGGQRILDPAAGRRRPHRRRQTPATTTLPQEQIIRLLLNLARGRPVRAGRRAATLHLRPRLAKGAARWPRRAFHSGGGARHQRGARRVGARRHAADAPRPCTSPGCSPPGHPRADGHGLGARSTRLELLARPRDRGDLLWTGRRSRSAAQLAAHGLPTNHPAAVVLRHRAAVACAPSPARLATLPQRAGRRACARRR